MSYTKFLDAADKYALWRKKNNLPQLHYEALECEVRDKWIQEKRYADLIGFINENWDSGNCDEFAGPLFTELIRSQEDIYYKQLWKGIVRHRLYRLWNSYKILIEREPNVNADQIASINLKSFQLNNETILGDKKKAVAYYRQFALDGLNKFKTGLQQLNDPEEIKRVEKLIHTVTYLQKPKPRPSTDKRKIDEALFWKLISEARKNAADKFEFIENLKNGLETFRPNELRNFQKHLLTNLNELNLWDLWALAYIVKRGCGDDGFDYFKSWVISKGREAFNTVLSLDESKLQSVFDEDPQLEELMSVASEVYEDKTGDIMQPVKVKQQEIKGTEWTEENLEMIFPSLCKLFDFQGQ